VLTGDRPKIGSSFSLHSSQIAFRDEVALPLNAGYKSLQNKNVGFDCHAARGIPRYRITPRGERQ
jgi:hypothetical protein